MRPLEAYLKRHIPSNLARVIDPQDVVQDTLFEAFLARPIVSRSTHPTRPGGGW